MLNLLHYGVVILCRAAVLLHKVHHGGHLRVGDKTALNPSGLTAAQGGEEHVAPSHQLFRALSIQNDAGFHGGGHGKGDP